MNESIQENDKIKNEIRLQNTNEMCFLNNPIANKKNKNKLNIKKILSNLVSVNIAINTYKLFITYSHDQPREGIDLLVSKFLKFRI
jgi:hypothetical protein